MAQSPAGNPSSKLSEEDGSEVIRAQLSIVMHPASNCKVVEQGAKVESMSQKLKLPRSCLDEIETTTDCTPDTCGECHANITVQENGEEKTAYLKSEIHEMCICPVFEEYDCIPEIRGVENGAVKTVVTVRDRSSLRDILQGLKEIDASVTIDWLVRGSEGDATVEFDVSNVTSKQQEALETALDAGYYNTPRETDLADLAEQLSISESAVSQRLNAIETKLVKSFLEE